MTRRMLAWLLVLLTACGGRSIDYRARYGQGYRYGDTRYGE